MADVDFLFLVLWHEGGGRWEAGGRRGALLSPILADGAEMPIGMESLCKKYSQVIEFHRCASVELKWR